MWIAGRSLSRTWPHDPGSSSCSTKSIFFRIANCRPVWCLTVRATWLLLPLRLPVAGTVAGAREVPQRIHIGGVAVHRAERMQEKVQAEADSLERLANPGFSTALDSLFSANTQLAEAVLEELNRRSQDDSIVLFHGGEKWHRSSEQVAADQHKLHSTEGAIGRIRDTLTTGATFESRYSVKSLMGSGGHGSIYVAEDRALGRSVALKVNKAPTRGQVLDAHLIREARFLSRLNHQSILPVLDIGRDDKGGCYFTMPLLSKQTLAEELHDAPLRGAALRRFLEHFVVAARAVQHAHQCGIVHRDVKPENIVVGKSGGIYLVDFGIAEWMLSSSDAETHPRHSWNAPLDPGLPPRTWETKATQTVRGSGYFIAPEAFCGELGPFDHRGDIYSLGAILYTALVGHPPHATESDGSSSIEAMARQAAQGISKRTSEVSPGCPKGLGLIAEHALDVHPAQRYQRVASMVADIVAWEEGRATSFGPAPFSTRVQNFAKRHPRGLVAVVVLLALIAVAGGLVSRRLSDDKDRITLAAERSNQRAAFLTDILSFGDPSGGQSDETIGQVVDRLPDTDTFEALDDEFKALMTLYAGRSSWSRSHFERGEALLLRAYALAEEALPKDDPALARYAFQLGRMHWGDDSNPLRLDAESVESLRWFDKTLSLLVDSPEEFRPLEFEARIARHAVLNEVEPMAQLIARTESEGWLAENFINQANSIFGQELFGAGEHARAAAVWESLLSIHSSEGVAPVILTNARLGLIKCYRESGHYEDALETAAMLITLENEKREPDFYLVFTVHSQIASIHGKAGDWALAAESRLTSASIADEFGWDDVALDARRNALRALTSGGLFAEAEILVKDLWHDLPKDGSGPILVHLMLDFAVFYKNKGEHDQAVEYVRGAVAIADSFDPNEVNLPLRTRINLAAFLSYAGRNDEAGLVIREVLVEAQGDRVHPDNLGLAIRVAHEHAFFIEDHSLEFECLSLLGRVPGLDLDSATLCSRSLRRAASR